MDARPEATGRIYIDSLEGLNYLLNLEPDFRYSNRSLAAVCAKIGAHYTQSNTKLYLQKALRRLLSEGQLSGLHQARAEVILLDIAEESQRNLAKSEIHNETRKRSKTMASHVYSQSGLFSHNVQNIFSGDHFFQSKEAAEYDTTIGETQSHSHEHGKANQKSGSLRKSNKKAASQSYASTAAKGDNVEDDLDSNQGASKKLRFFSADDDDTVGRAEPSELAQSTMKVHKQSISESEAKDQASPTQLAMTRAGAAKKAVEKAQRDFLATCGEPEELVDAARRRHERLLHEYKSAQEAVQSAVIEKESRILFGSGHASQNQLLSAAASVPNVSAPGLGTLVIGARRTHANEDEFTVARRYEKQPLHSMSEETTAHPSIAEPPAAGLVTEVPPLDARQSAKVNVFPPPADLLSTAGAGDMQTPLRTPDAAARDAHRQVQMLRSSQDNIVVEKTGGHLLELEDGRSKTTDVGFRGSQQFPRNDPMVAYSKNSGKAGGRAMSSKLLGSDHGKQRYGAQLPKAFPGHFLEDSEDDDEDKENVSQLGEWWKQQGPRSAAVKNIEDPFSVQVNGGSPWPQRRSSGKSRGCLGTKLNLEEPKVGASQERCKPPDNEKQPESSFSPLKFLLPEEDGPSMGGQDENKQDEKIARLPYLDSQRLLQQVQEKRHVLKSLCKQHHMMTPPDADPKKVDALLKNGVLGLTEVLATLEQHIKAKDAEAESRRSLNEKVAVFLDVVGQEQWLAEYNKDDKRFSGAKGQHKLRSKAEKARKDVSKLPEMANALQNDVTSWEETHGKPFYYDILRLKTMLDEYMKTTSLHARKEGKLVHPQAPRKKLILKKSSQVNVQKKSQASQSNVRGLAWKTTENGNAPQQQVAAIEKDTEKLVQKSSEFHHETHRKAEMTAAEAAAALLMIHAAQDPAPKLSEAPPTKSALDATKPHDADVSPKWLEEVENAVTAGTFAEMHVAERRVSVQEILTVKSEALVDAPKFHTGGVIPISSDGTEKPAIGGCFGKGLRSDSPPEVFYVTNAPPGHEFIASTRSHTEAGYGTGASLIAETEFGKAGLQQEGTQSQADEALEDEVLAATVSPDTPLNASLAPSGLTDGGEATEPRWADRWYYNPTFDNGESNEEEAQESG